jgi:hypothetical protein
MRSLRPSSGWLFVLVLSGLISLPACDSDSTGSGGKSAGGGGAGGSDGGSDGGAGGSAGNGGSGGSTGNLCDDYCKAVDAINASLGCNPFDCSMTCPDAVAMWKTQGCEAEGTAAFQCIKDTPESSWNCDAGNGELIYGGGECAVEVDALTMCQMP